MKTDELKPYEDKIVTLFLRDGEVIEGKIAFVDFEYKDIAVDIIETNRLHLYKRAITSGAFAIKADDVVSVEAISSGEIT